MLQTASWQHCQEVCTVANVPLQCICFTPLLHTMLSSQRVHMVSWAPSWMNEWMNGAMECCSWFFFSDILPPIHTLNLPIIHLHSMSMLLCNSGSAIFWLIGNDNLYNITCLYCIGAAPPHMEHSNCREIARSAGGSHVMYPWWIRALVSVHRTEQALMDNGRNHRRKRQGLEEGGGCN